VKEAESRQTISLDVHQPAQYYLLWFTRPSPAKDEPGRYQIEISDVSLRR
jgi:hypothetical protein